MSPTNDHSKFQFQLKAVFIKLFDKTALFLHPLCVWKLLVYVAIAVWLRTSAASAYSVLAAGVVAVDTGTKGSEFFF